MEVEIGVGVGSADGPVDAGPRGDDDDDGCIIGCRIREIERVPAI